MYEFIERLIENSYKENNLPEPDFIQEEEFKAILFRPRTDQAPIKYPTSSHQVTQEYRCTSVEVRNLVKALNGEMSRQEIQEELGLKDRVNFKENYLDPAIAAEIVKMKYPDSPNHPKQKYVLTKKGTEIKNN